MVKRLSRRQRLTCQRGVYASLVDTSTITLVRVEPTRWLTPSEDRAWRAWLAMTERVRAQIARDLLVDSGLSDADYMVLVHLSEAEGRRVR